jgi:ligand-binding sensor domain-containing protein/signal transduction histidine kinase
MIFRIVLIAHILSCMGESAVAQIDFFHLTQKDGLQSSNVRCITQDYQGFMWIGTEDGLHRYDGSSMVSYRHSNEDSLSLSSNYVLVLFEDSKKNLWVGTLDGGLLRYDRKNDHFIKIGQNKNSRNGFKGNTVLSIIEDRSGFLLTGTEEGVMNYFKIPPHPDEEPEIMQLSNLNKSEEEKTNNAFTSTSLDKNGNLWVAFYGYGIAKVDLKSNQVFPNPFPIAGALHSMKIDSKNRLWLGTWHDGIYAIDLDSKRKAHFFADGKKNSLLHNFVTVIEEDLDGNIWIGTDEGINVIKSTDDPFNNPELISLQHDDQDNQSLLSNPIKAIAVDNVGRVWIGSIYGGVNIYDKHAPDFTSIRKHPLKARLNHNNVTAFVRDEEKKLWIASDGGGVNVIEGGVQGLLKNQFQKLALINTHTGKEEIKVKCLENDGAGNIWVGTWGAGMFKVNSKTLKTEHYSKFSSAHPLPSNEIIFIKQDHHNRLWVGTWGAGLFSLRQGSNEIIRYPFLQQDETYGRFEKVSAIFEDLAGKIWISRESGGFSYLDEENKNFITINDSILTRDLTINSIHQDSSNIFWLGTNSSGLIRFDPVAKASERLDERFGLISPAIHSIVPDQQNRLWLATNSGISVFDKRRKKFNNFSKNPELFGNQYNNNSYFLNDDGMIVFGGIKGINAFVPANMKSYVPQATMAFTGFSVHNIPFTVRNHDLKENIILIDSIELEHNQNSISIEFTAIDFNFAADRKYAFLLEGFNDSWQNIGPERKTTFTNLSPGEYRFKIKSSNEEGVWTEGKKALYIYIRPAWWQTLWFKVSLVVAVAGILFLSIRLRERYLKRQQKHLGTLVRERTSELNIRNQELAEKITEISNQNKELNLNKLEIALMNHEIQTQNEELKSQNDQIINQREELEIAQEKLQSTNDGLEKLVEERTKKLKTTIRQLDKTVFELDRFVYSASHDLSAPLKSILGLLHLARVENDIARLNEYHRYIEGSIYKLELVIKSLVDYSRNAHMELDLKPAKIRDLMQEVIEELIFLPESSSIHFYNNIDENIVLTTDYYRLKLIFQNIINNAIKYSDPSKKENYVIITCETFKNKLKIQISDNGIGIDNESLPKIFSMYFRATEKSKGSGLGLFIVRETVQKLNGKISVNSEKWNGSMFTLILPFEIKNKPKIPAEQSD